MKMKTLIAILVISPVLVLGVFEVQSEAAPDFSAIKDVKARKKAFFDYLRPMVQAVNQERAQERKSVLEIRKKIVDKQSISSKDKRTIISLSKRYEIDHERDDLAAIIDELLIHLDQIPVSMVLAQAAIESAWGTSRFARLGNNYFGQWCYKKGCGFVPRERASGAVHEVRKFSNTEAAIKSYFLNLNGHRAYAKVRAIRAEARKRSQPLSGMKMVEGLIKYSQRGAHYITELRQIIRVNKLE